MKGTRVKKSKKSKKPELKQKLFACLKVNADGYGEVVWQCPYCHDFWSVTDLKEGLWATRCPHCHKKFAKWSKDLEVRLSAELVKVENNIKTWRCPHDGCGKEWNCYAIMESCPHCGGLLTA